MRARLCSFIIKIRSPNIGTDLFSWQRQLKGLRVEPIMMHEVAPSMILKNISPFKAISGPLRAFNLIGALPLRFRQDVCGKTRVRHLKYQSMPNCIGTFGTKPYFMCILRKFTLFCQISYSMRVELPKILLVLIPFGICSSIWSVMMNEANIPFEEVLFM